MQERLLRLAAALLEAPADSFEFALFATVGSSAKLLRRSTRRDAISQSGRIVARPASIDVLMSPG
jgi:hypothetical protein